MVRINSSSSGSAQNPMSNKTADDVYGILKRHYREVARLGNGFIVQGERFTYQVRWDDNEQAWMIVPIKFTYTGGFHYLQENGSY